MDLLNNWIEKGYDAKIRKMLDEEIINNHEKYPSIKKKQNEIDNILADLLQNLNVSEELINLTKLNLYNISIPTATKSVVYGITFNKIIFSRIQKYTKFNTNLVCKKEISVPYLQEKVDFYIEDIVSNKILICYNQIDLWSGGHQMNRGDKYILNDNFYNNLPINVKLICLVNKFEELKTDKSKKYRILNHGMTTKRLFYPKYLRKIICEYFIDKVD